MHSALAEACASHMHKLYVESTSKPSTMRHTHDCVRIQCKRCVMNSSTSALQKGSQCSIPQEVSSLCCDWFLVYQYNTCCKLVKFHARVFDQAIIRRTYTHIDRRHMQQQAYDLTRNRTHAQTRDFMNGRVMRLRVWLYGGCSFCIWIDCSTASASR